MENLKKVRYTLTGAFVFGICALAWLLLHPFENSWILWSARGGAGFFGIFAAAVATVFLATCFPADKEDPWKSSYFRYMRNLWGIFWGGKEHPYHISLCPAVRYTWLTLFALFLFVGISGVLIYHTLAIAYGGFEASFMWSEKEKIVPQIIATALVFGIMTNFAVFLLFQLLFSKPANLPDSADLVFCSFVSFLAMLTLLVAPIQSFGAVAVGKVMLWGIGIVGIGVFVIWLFIILMKAGFKLIKGVYDTMPGQMIFSSLNQTLCPEIVEQYKRREPQQEE